jgi:DNA-binding MarR family transcriptional regulator
MPECKVITEQAARLVQLMPNILRRLFSLGISGVLAEMPLGQLRICAYLMDGPRSMSAIAEELGMSTSAVTQIADRMERAELVERVPAIEDRRLKHLHLTEKARQLMNERKDMRTQRAQEALALLPADTREQLLESLELLLNAAQATAHPANPDLIDQVRTTV